MNYNKKEEKKMLGYVISKKLIEKSVEVVSSIVEKEKEIFNSEFRFRSIKELEDYLRSCGINTKGREYIYEGHMYSLDVNYGLWPMVYGIKLKY